MTILCTIIGSTVTLSRIHNFIIISVIVPLSLIQKMYLLLVCILYFETFFLEIFGSREESEVMVSSFFPIGYVRFNECTAGL